MKKIFYTVLSVLVLSACSTDGVDVESRDGQQRSKLAANTGNTEELEKAAEERRLKREKAEKERLENQTTMEVLPLEYDFGTIEKEVPVSTIFKVKNTGNKPLILNDAKASCGCTVPRKPEEPIMPGETGELEVVFTSKKGQEGAPFSKSVTVTANIPGSTKQVRIKGNVMP